MNPSEKPSWLDIPDEVWTEIEAEEVPERRLGFSAASLAVAMATAVLVWSPLSSIEGPAKLMVAATWALHAFNAIVWLLVPFAFAGDDGPPVRLCLSLRIKSPFPAVLARAVQVTWIAGVAWAGWQWTAGMMIVSYPLTWLLSRIGKGMALDRLKEVAAGRRLDLEDPWRPAIREAAKSIAKMMAR